MEVGSIGARERRIRRLERRPVCAPVEPQSCREARQRDVAKLGAGVAAGPSDPQAITRRGYAPLWDLVARKHGDLEQLARSELRDDAVYRADDPSAHEPRGIQACARGAHEPAVLDPAGAV